MNVYKSFIYMFYALDAIYDESPSDELGDYLSGLNPFWFNDEGSADPAEYEEFKESYINTFGEKKPATIEIYKFCKKYLEKNAPQKAIEAFNQIEKSDWIEAFEEAKL